MGFELNEQGCSKFLSSAKGLAPHALRQCPCRELKEMPKEMPKESPRLGELMTLAALAALSCTAIACLAVKPCQAVEARRRPGKNGKEDRSGDPHEKALHEERSLLCLGLPALWTTEQTKDFFSKYEGEVEAVYMCETQTAVHLVFEANQWPDTLVLSKAYTGPTLM